MKFTTVLLSLSVPDVIPSLQNKLKDIEGLLDFLAERKPLAATNKWPRVDSSLVVHHDEQSSGNTGRNEQKKWRRPLFSLRPPGASNTFRTGKPSDEKERVNITTPISFGGRDGARHRICPVLVKQRKKNALPSSLL